MRILAIVVEGADDLAEWLDARVVPYNRRRGEWADFFEWNRYVDVSEVAFLRLIMVDLDSPENPIVVWG